MWKGFVIKSSSHNLYYCENSDFHKYWDYSLQFAAIFETKEEARDLVDKMPEYFTNNVEIVEVEFEVKLALEEIM